MEIKASLLGSLSEFILDHRGEKEHRTWKHTLRPEVREILDQPVLTSEWLPMKPYFAEPLMEMTNQFYEGLNRGAWESGRFSADKGLSGIYRFFIKMGTPSFVVKKCTGIMSNFYRPARMECVSCSRNSAIVRITEFPEPDSLVEARIAGWMEKALELSGCRDLSMTITESLTEGHSFTEYRASWG